MRLSRIFLDRDFAFNFRGKVSYITAKVCHVYVCQFFLFYYLLFFFQLRFIQNKPLNKDFYKDISLHCKRKPPLGNATQENSYGPEKISSSKHYDIEKFHIIEIPQKINHYPYSI